MNKKEKVNLWIFVVVFVLGLYLIFVIGTISENFCSTVECSCEEIDMSPESCNISIFGCCSNETYECPYWLGDKIYLDNWNETNNVTSYPIYQDGENATSYFEGDISAQDVIDRTPSYLNRIESVYRGLYRKR